MKPYVTISFANRNDNYGGVLAERIELFIEYYAHFVKKWPDLFEFVIVDYNPPEDKPRLRDAFKWDKLGRVIHCEVTPEVHQAIPGASVRKIQDYIGRNIGLRYGTAPYAMVLNQDIFVSSSIVEEIAKQRLLPNYFYRADRCDFNLEPCKGHGAPDFEKLAEQHSFVVHRRHGSKYHDISVEVTPATIQQMGSQPEDGDRVDNTSHIIYCDASRIWQEEDIRLYGDKTTGLTILRRGGQFFSPEYYGYLRLHTNASGDFMLASKKAWAVIRGFPEDPGFYMGTDAYGVFQLFAAGYEQAIFMPPHRVYHADHDRSGRAGFQEPDYAFHQKRFNALVKKRIPPVFNSEQWALEAYPLKFWNHPAPDLLSPKFIVVQ